MSKGKGVAIRVKPDTRERLRAFGMKSETYDDVIRRILYECEELRRDNRAQEARIKECEEAREP